MRTINSLKEIFNELQSLSASDWLVVDIDNTLITTTDSIFKSNSPDKNFIDNFKNLNPNTLEDNLSKWRLKRKIQLVEPEWLEIFNKNPASIYGLTQMHTGSYGVIPRMEEWRLRELNSLGLNFSKHNCYNLVQTLINSFDKQSATIYKGVMFTGSYKKSEVLSSFIKQSSGKPTKIIFVDDRKEQVSEIEQWVNQTNIDSICVIYNAADKKIGDISLERNALQIESFLNGSWLSDEEADEQLNK